MREKHGEFEVRRRRREGKDVHQLITEAKDTQLKLRETEVRGGREGGNWEGREAGKKVVGMRGYSYKMYMYDPVSVLYNAVVFHSV